VPLNELDFVVFRPGEVFMLVLHGCGRRYSCAGRDVLAGHSAERRRIAENGLESVDRH
jgi:hypothetical protein